MHFKKNKKTAIKIVFFILFVVYVIIQSVSSYHYRNVSSGKQETIYSLGYGFGPLVKGIVENHKYNNFNDPRFSSHRMPFIPTFLALIASIKGNVLFAYIIKNLLFTALLFLAIFRAYLCFDNLRRHKLWILISSFLFLLSFPQIVYHCALIDTEEGYLIQMIALVFIYLLIWDKSEINLFVVCVLAFLTALLFLTKSSMIILTPVFCLFYFIKSRKIRVFAIFLLYTSVGFLGWGLFNYSHSKVFTISSSFNGINFYKGNNTLTSSIYPPGNLDVLYKQMNEIHESMENEWDIDKHWMKKSIDYIKLYPLEKLKRIRDRIIICYIEPRNTPAHKGEKRITGLFGWQSFLYMLIYRILLIPSLVLAVLTILKAKKKKGKGSISNNPGFINSIIYLGFIVSYTLPYLMSFVYERHVVPMIFPTVFYLLRVLDDKIYESLKKRNFNCRQDQK